MPEGRWYLYYRYETGVEGGSFGQVKVELDASTKDEAVAKAGEKWRALVAEGAHPAPPFKYKAYLRQPYLVYAMPLDGPPLDTRLDPLVSL